LFWPGPENEQQASSYFRKSTKITWYFAGVVVAACACLLSGDGVPVTGSRLACVVCTASVARVMRVPRVVAAALFLLLVFVDRFC
jgi:hypothetical protein